MFICHTIITYPIINAKLKNMKRKTLLLLTISVIAAATVLAQNQLSGGLVAGANYSYLKGDESNSNASYDWKWKWGPVGGIYVNFPIGNSVSLMPMALYSQMGGRYYYTDNTGTYKWTQNLGYLSVPVPLKINAGNAIAILVGPQFDLLVGAKVKDANDN